MLPNLTKSTLLLGVLAVFLANCADEPPPCTPLDGATQDPCAGNISSDSSRSRSPVGVWLHQSAALAAHIVVRGQYIPETVRCVPQNSIRGHPYTKEPDWETRERDSHMRFDEWAIICYADIQVAAYIIGQGPSLLTTVARIGKGGIGVAPAHMDEESRELEQELNQVAHSDGRSVWRITGTESIMFLGPSVETSVESWGTFAVWDLERRDDGTVVVVHPDRDYWEEQYKYNERHRSQAEMTLTAFKQAVEEAHRSRIAEYDGRIGEWEGFPMLVTDTGKLHDFYVASGAASHPDGPPAKPPPPR